jgi:hypothetical protein
MGIFAVRTAVALAGPLLTFTALSDAKSETALEVQSWCEPIVTAQIPTPDTVHFVPTFQTGFCWGAFGAIEQMATIYNDNGMMIGICAPADTGRRQLIMVFNKYVVDHLESANLPFAVIAQRALVQAFPCSR